MLQSTIVTQIVLILVLVGIVFIISADIGICLLMTLPVVVAMTGLVNLGIYSSM